MAQPNQVLVSPQWEFWSQTWSWNLLYLLSWLVFSVSMGSSSLLSSSRKVTKILLKLKLVDPSDYDNGKGYKHLVSGICCGFSGLVQLILLTCIIRLLASLSVLLETLGCAWMLLNRNYSWAWFSFWSSQRLSGCSDWSWLLFYQHEDLVENSKRRI